MDNGTFIISLVIAFFAGAFIINANNIYLAQILPCDEMPHTLDSASVSFSKTSSELKATLKGSDFLVETPDCETCSLSTMYSPGNVAVFNEDIDRDNLKMYGIYKFNNSIDGKIHQYIGEKYGCILSRAINPVLEDETCWKKEDVKAELVAVFYT